MKHFSLEFEPVSPFRLDLTVWALRRRPDNIVDRWDDGTYRRVLVTDNGEPFEVSVTQSSRPASPHLQVVVKYKKSDENIKRQVALALERVLGINLSLDSFYSLADQDDRLKPVADQFLGFKPPRLYSPFEALVNAIACQQLTLTMGIRLLNSLVKTYGPAFECDKSVSHAFPRPCDLANADIEDLRKMKFSYQKARYIIGLAESLTYGEFDLDSIHLLDDRNAVDRLCDLKGVGRWTAEYFLLRGLGRTHIFPADDVGARNHLQRWLGITENLNYDAIHEILKPWKEYGGLIYFHLLLKSLSEKSVITE